MAVTAILDPQLKGDSLETAPEVTTRGSLRAVSAYDWMVSLALRAVGRYPRVSLDDLTWRAATSPGTDRSSSPPGPADRAARGSPPLWGSEIGFRACGQSGGDVVLVGESPEDLPPADPVLCEVDLWVPKTYATRRYS